MSADLSLVLVTHRSSAATPAAVASFRAQLHAAGVAGEVVIVDHSEDAGETARLRELAPDRLLANPNRGFAAGVNAGVAVARGGTILAGNPDIVFEPGSLAALLDALAAGREIVGPQFTLAGFLFPPADLQTPREAFLRWRAGRSPRLWRQRLRRELARARTVWEASAPVPLPTLSGALLAFRRAVWERVGAWDEGYFLFFEETDWLRRAGAAGLRIALVPTARVRHAWGHAADPERTGGTLAASRVRYFAARHGWRGRLALRLPPPRAPITPLALPADAAALPGGRLQWLLSPTGLGFPAAGLVGSAEELLCALRGVAGARGGRGRFLVLAVTDGLDLAGAWSWEGGNG